MACRGGDQYEDTELDLTQNKGLGKFAVETVATEPIMGGQRQEVTPPFTRPCALQAIGLSCHANLSPETQNGLFLA